MGTLSTRAAAAGYDVVLVSADKDLLQLVGPNVTMFHTGRNKRYDPALVAADFGLPPERIADVLALVGDAVDNVPGVPGIGDKGAQTAGRGVRLGGGAARAGRGDLAQVATARGWRTTATRRCCRRSW